jgi:N-acyl-D-aspartate/D-glutamate deacylase
VLDLAIRGGEVVDGTGRQRVRADVGVSDGRVVGIGEIASAGEEVDATGRIVAPGFVDVHTHYDAQVFWDGTLSPSSLHGVTTTVSGNCGFTLAPLSEDASDYLVRMLAVVEGMSLEALQAGVPCDWTSTREFFERVEGKIAINMGFMVGHSALRRVVMGAAASERTASPDELEAMERLLREGLAAGGLGFSSSWGAVHFDADGRPVPSRFSSREELVALSKVCRDFDGTSVEFIPSRVDRFDEEARELLTAMSLGAGRPLNWNVLRIESEEDDGYGPAAAAAHAIEHGASVIALNMPILSRARYSFKTGFVLDALPGWQAVLSLPLDQRLRALMDTRVRDDLRRGAGRAQGSLAEIAEWGNRLIVETFSERTRVYEGRAVSEIARAEGKDDLDALLDIACADELETRFARPPADPTRGAWLASAAAWRQGWAVIGGSDAGAHLDFTAYFDYPVYVIEKAVRDVGVLSLEEAIHLLTDVPASLYGLRDRGRIEEGGYADIVIFDEATLATGPMRTRFDLPSGAARLYAEPSGIDRVIVNGATIVVDGQCVTGVAPGRLLRSGRDTTTRLCG